VHVSHRWPPPPNPDRSANTMAQQSPTVTWTVDGICATCVDPGTDQGVTRARGTARAAKLMQIDGQGRR
jgi:hypothetical protein